MAGVRGWQPFTDHLLQSNLEMRRYGSESLRQTADDGRARICEAARWAYWTVREAEADRRRAEGDAAAASDGRVDRWG